MIARRPAARHLRGWVHAGPQISMPPPTVTPAQAASAVLTAADVNSIVQAAAASVNVPLVIAVTDRSGNTLAIYKKANAPATAIGNYRHGRAIGSGRRIAGA